MKIEQEKTYRPVTITLETRSEYDNFFKIIDEAIAGDAGEVATLNIKSRDMATELSNFATNNA